MNNGEFYLSREENYIGENKRFPAEIYKKVIEDNPLGKEKADLGKEITTLQEKKRIKGNKEKDSRGFVEKVFKSIKGVATTATVATSAIVITSTIITSSISANLVNLDVGGNYVEYEIEISDINDENCFLVVSGTDETITEKEIQENGVYKGRVEGLKPEWEYTISVVSRDNVLGEITHFQHKLQTQKHTEYAPDPPPNSYTGLYENPIIDEKAINWASRQMTVPIVFEKIEDKYYYKLIVEDENGNVLQEIKGNDNMSAMVNVLENTSTYKFTFQIFGVGEAEEVLILSQDLGIYQIIQPKAMVKAISPIGQNLLRIEFESQGVENLALQIEAGDEVTRIELSPTQVSLGYIDVSTLETSTKIKATPIMIFEDYTVLNQPFEADLEGVLEIEPFVNLKDNSLILYIKAITNGATYLHVESLQDETITGNYGFYSGRATVGYEMQGEIACTMYLVGQDGERLSDDATVVVNTAQELIKPEYVMNYVNPGNMGVTYNDNETINLYIQTNFECEDESYYYQIEVGEYMIKSRDKVAIIRNLPNESYPIRYSVCFDKDGNQYVIETVTPSGTANESRFPGMISLVDNSLTITIYDSRYVDLNSIRLITSYGEEIQVSENDFTLNEGQDYVAVIEFETSPEHVITYAMISPYPVTGEYEGSLYTQYIKEIYPE